MIAVYRLARRLNDETCAAQLYRLSIALIFSQKPGKYLTLYNSSGPITRPLIHAAHAERERRGAIIFFI